MLLFLVYPLSLEVKQSHNLSLNLVIRTYFRTLGNDRVTKFR